MLRVFVDTNILAYQVATESPNTTARLRAFLMKSLYRRVYVVLVAYEDQLFEIRRTIKDILIHESISRPEKLDVADTILNDFERFFKECEEAGRCRVVENDASFTKRAGALYRVAASCVSRRKIGRITFDLELLAVAEANDAVFLTHDQGLYEVYSTCLRSRAKLPSFYYLAIERGMTYYKVCGNRFSELEVALREAASKVRLTYRDPEIVC